jgi:isopentenyl-diphosphate delta-isomerase type 1
MADEFFDVVNERDEPTGRALRREVHAQSLWHRAVHVMVFDSAGRLFLQKRSMAKDMAAGLWDLSCSGHVDAGEEYDTAAVRELGEELGITPTVPLERILRIDACADTGWEFCWIYRTHHDGPFVLHPEEIETGEWLAPAEVTRQMAVNPAKFTAPFRMIWGTYSR